MRWIGKSGWDASKALILYTHTLTEEGGKQKQIKKQRLQRDRHVAALFACARLTVRVCFDLYYFEGFGCVKPKKFLSRPELVLHREADLCVFTLRKAGN